MFLSKIICYLKSTYLYEWRRELLVVVVFISCLYLFMGMPLVPLGSESNGWNLFWLFGK